MSVEVKGSAAAAAVHAPPASAAPSAAALKRCLSGRSVVNPRPTTSAISTPSVIKSATKSSIRVLQSSNSVNPQKAEPSSSDTTTSTALSALTCFSDSNCACGELIIPSTTPAFVSSLYAATTSVSNSSTSSSSSPSTATPAATAAWTSSSLIRSRPSNQPPDVQRRWITSERLNELRKKTHEAIRNHKIFTIRGCFATVRRALLQRGFVEKLDVHRKASLACNLTMDEMIHQLPNRQPGESKRQYIAKCERNIISRFLEHTPVDFLWTFRKEKADWIDMARNPTLLTNKFHKVPFTTKEGICASLRDFHWFYIDEVSEMYYPRCYNVWNPDELDDFIDDFRLTACISMLRFVIDTFNNKGVTALLSSGGTIPVTSIQFAIKRCREYVNFSEHFDIDSCEERQRIWDHDWDVFLAHHYYLTHENGRIAECQMGQPFDVFLSMAAKVLQDLEPFWSQFNIDGHLNIWIVKPANRCRGKGILLMNNIKKIISLVNPSTITKTRFVVQKYMERPLTIYNTKFDIRQWFLITSVQPLNIWMYRESYLRFSSQEYNLHNYHESVHLTNHAVQKKYCNGTARDERLPAENMWDCHTFQTYLRQIGKHDMWMERIYPGMQRAIIGTMLASQDNMDRRPNTFELFGADFMISEDFFPWLIEINSSPDLGNTTSVTARMCPQCLEDTVKVVIDRRNDPKADTGGFELIYKQNIPPSPAYMGLNLFLKGQQITQKSGNAKRDGKVKEETRNLKQFVMARSVSSNGGGGGNGSEKARKVPVIMDLIDCLDVKSGSKRPFTRGQAHRTPHSYLKSKAKVDVDYREKNNGRRHHSCGPVLRHSNTPRVVGEGADRGMGAESCIVPAQHQPQPSLSAGDSNLITCIGSRVMEKEENTVLPVISSSRKSSSDSVIVALKSPPKAHWK